MIRAPFRFDVQYFSLILLLRSSMLDKKILLQNKHDKDEYIQQMKSKGRSAEEIADIKSSPFINLKCSQPALYIYVCNSKMETCYASINCYEDLPLDLQLISNSLQPYYQYIKDQCNSDAIKMTRKGSLVVDYFHQDQQLTFKIENQPINKSQKWFEDFWDTIVKSWNDWKYKKINLDPKIFDQNLVRGTALVVQQEPIAKMAEEKSQSKSKCIQQIEILDSEGHGQSDLAQANNRNEYEHVTEDKKAKKLEKSQEYQAKHILQSQNGSANRENKANELESKYQTPQNKYSSTVYFDKENKNFTAEKMDEELEPSHFRFKKDLVSRNQFIDAVKTVAKEQADDIIRSIGNQLKNIYAKIVQIGQIVKNKRQEQNDDESDVAEDKDAYELFFRENHQYVSAKSGNQAGVGLQELCVRCWKELTLSKKQQYRIRAQQERQQEKEIAYKKSRCKKSSKNMIQILNLGNEEDQVENTQQRVEEQPKAVQKQPKMDAKDLKGAEKEQQKVEQRRSKVETKQSKGEVKQPKQQVQPKAEAKEQKKVKQSKQDVKQKLSVEQSKPSKQKSKVSKQKQHRQQKHRKGKKSESSDDESYYEPRSKKPSARRNKHK